MDNLFTVKQVAFILKVHPLTIRRYIRDKKLSAVKIAGAVRIKNEDLLKFQKDYLTTSKHSSPISLHSVTKEFSLEDPFWKLEGIGASLSLPAED
jgi:excisionase family DNA binding protein